MAKTVQTLIGLKKNSILMKFLQKTPKCVLKLCFEAMKVLLVCVFLISRAGIFLNATFTTYFRTIFYFQRFFENQKYGSTDFFKKLSLCAWQCLQFYCVNIDYYMLRGWYRFYSRVCNTISRTSESSGEWPIWYYKRVNKNDLALNM